MEIPIWGPLRVTFSWKCPHCSFLNEDWMTYCHDCGKARSRWP